jgi:hypothetical protein
MRSDQFKRAFRWLVWLVLALMWFTTARLYLVGPPPELGSAMPPAR